MKALTGIIRIFVGILFIISGFIKLNDPVGFSFKLQEYFSPGVLNLEYLSPFALAFAISLVIAEVILGVALIIGYAKKATLWLLLAMIVFFTFLTFYSAYFNKVTDCGCFGDALPLTPWQSFSKDVLLLLLILFLFFGKKYIQPFFTRFWRSVIILVSFIACLVYGYYVLMHLPVFDFRPYKIGANITEGMTVPPGAPAAVYDYNWKFEENGEEKIITTQGDYPQTSGTFISVETEEVQAGYVPPIHDFTIEKNGENLTEQFLTTENLLVIVAYNLAKTEHNGWPVIKNLIGEAQEKGYSVIGLTASGDEAVTTLKYRHGLELDFYFTDETVLKTIVRSNPGILKLQNGTIIQKKHWNDASEIILKRLDASIATIDFSLKRKLDSIFKYDHLYRPVLQEANPEKRKQVGKKLGLAPEDYTGDLWARQRIIDTANLKFVKNLLDRGIYPGKTLVGEPTNLVAFKVIQHNQEQISQYLDLFKAAAERDELPKTLVAAMEDRYLMHQKQPQIYGTQAIVNSAKGSFIWPIKDVDTVNKRRKLAGFHLGIEEYAKNLIGKDYEFENVSVDEVSLL
ncbi:MAG: BT_3928 family protein [Leeuwenhoekiella sp.]